MQEEAFTPADVKVGEIVTSNNQNMKSVAYKSVWKSSTFEYRYNWKRS